jgi:hypothetical protein
MRTGPTLSTTPEAGAGSSGRYRVAMVLLILCTLLVTPQDESAIDGSGLHGTGEYSLVADSDGTMECILRVMGTLTEISQKNGLHFDGDISEERAAFNGDLSEKKDGPDSVLQ